MRIVEEILDYLEKLRKQSLCDRAQHACILTDRFFMPIGVGYNGPPRKLPKKCERPEEVGNCGCIHAEVNALLSVNAYYSPKAAFITSHPCENCARIMINADITLVCYTGPGHRNYQTGLDVLDRAGIIHGTSSQICFSEWG